MAAVKWRIWRAGWQFGRGAPEGRWGQAGCQALHHVGDEDERGRWSDRRQKLQERSDERGQVQAGHEDHRKGCRTECIL